MKPNINLTLITALIVLTINITSIFSSEGPNYLPQRNAVVSNLFVQTNNINTCFRSDGIFNYDKITFTSSVAGFVWPVAGATRMTADFAAGLWIGAMYGTQNELRTSACIYNSLYSPGNIPVPGQVPPNSVCNDPSFRAYLVNLIDPNLINGGTVVKNAGGRDYTITYDAWSSWPVNQGAPYVEVNNIPGYQPGPNADRPGIGNSSARPDEISFMVYMDYTNCTNNVHNAEISLPGGTLPLGAEVQQLSFAYSAGILNNMYFMKWKIINKSGNAWNSTYISIVDDADLGSGSDDAAGCDTIRQTGFIYNATNNDVLYGTAPPAVGYRLLQGPLVHTGNPNDTAKMPYGNLVGYKLTGMTGYNVFANVNDPCIGDPSNATEGYNFMSGLNGCGQPLINPQTSQPTKFVYSGNACSRTGWVDNTAQDRRQILSCGPLTMNANDTQVIASAVIIGRSSSNFQSVCTLLSVSDSARKYYYSDFGSVPTGIQPKSSNIPEKFALYQNYPNPFNPVTNILFDIPSSASGNVQIVIYNMVGQSVKTLLNEELKAGSYEISFDAGNLPSGAYFYRLISPKFTETKKMVLLK